MLIMQDSINIHKHVTITTIFYKWVSLKYNPFDWNKQGTSLLIVYLVSCLKQVVKYVHSYEWSICYKQDPLLWWKIISHFDGVYLVSKQSMKLKENEWLIINVRVDGQKVKIIRKYMYILKKLVVRKYNI